MLFWPFISSVIEPGAKLALCHLLLQPRKEIAPVLFLKPFVAPGLTSIEGYSSEQLVCKTATEREFVKFLGELH